MVSPHRTNSGALRKASYAALVAVTLVARGASADPSTTSPEQGYDLGEIPSPRSVGMGGAQTALGTSTTALYLNPANLPFARVYHFEGIAAVSPDARRQTYGGAITDSTTSKLSGGVGGAWSQLDPDGIHRTWTDFRLALAYPISDRIGLGATGRYLRANQSVATGPFGADTASNGTPGDPVVNLITFDAGLTVVPASGFQLGAVGKNLTNPGNSLAPTTLAGGLGYANGQFAVEADGLADFTTWRGTRGRFMLGGEVFLADHVPLRAGYRYDDGQRAHSVSGGAGYVDKKWSFELSVRRDVVADHPMTLFVAGIRYFMDNGANQDGGGGMLGSDQGSAF